ncbi:carboxypeptidase-like regulatory domain-containing protein [Marinirhabdus gelatinilytica]|uniref:Carboxypeptidase family protein n=1 Tax=Marinirhabdus gelatinilytica TaxID=1703343 RepID=A0A370QJW3_9FLAO|nr:carboxypeptidase-like regulatory domain-containing protein [Marinirhabdus gelatinilytica]RDK88619.1 hypothetical protein C8D94_101494 [Marinirhabdus gelatinilytica]
MKKLVSLLFVILILGCSNDDDKATEEPVSCTEEFVYGLSAQVHDAATGGIIPNGVTVVAQDGDYTETLDFVFDTHIGAGERPGTYTLTASKEGYETKMAGPITVSMDEDMCHVITQSVTIALEAN